MNNTTFDLNTFNQVSAIIITLVAVGGNSIVLVILARPEFRKQSLFRYLFIATIFDTLNALQIWPNSYFDFFLINQLDISCKLYSYLPSVTNVFSSWMNALSSIDVYLTVNYSSKFLFRKNLKTQILAMSITFVMAVVLNLPMYFYAIIRDPIGCSSYSYQVSFYINLNFIIVFLIIPFIFMVLANSLVFIQLKKQKKLIENQDNREVYKKAKSLFNLSLGMNFLFLASNLPCNIVFIVGNLSNTIFSDFFYDVFYLISFTV